MRKLIKITIYKLLFPPLLPLLLTSAWVWVLIPDLHLLTDLTDFSLEFLKWKMASARPRQDFIGTENSFRMNGASFLLRNNIYQLGR